jgi:hypothetical protein
MFANDGTVLADDDAIGIGLDCPSSEHLALMAA